MKLFEINHERADRICTLLNRTITHHVHTCAVCWSTPYDDEGDIYPDCEEYWRLSDSLEKWREEALFGDLDGVHD